MTEQVRQDIMSSIEAMFYTPNYCDLYMHVNQVRVMLCFDKVLIDTAVEENKWVIEQFRKYVGSHQATVMRHPTLPDMMGEVDAMIERAEETNTAPRELLYMFLRDEWLAQLHTVIANAIDALRDMDEDEEETDA